MEPCKVPKTLKWLILLALLAMLTVNALSSILPINGVTPKEVSDRYPNLFVPAPLTFAIWGVIYILVFAYTLFQFGIFHRRGEAVNAQLLTRTGIVFIITCILNLSWIIAWHYGLLTISFLLLALLLLALIDLRLIIQAYKPLSVKEKWFVRLPFSVYFGWVTIATIAGAAALLVGNGFGGLGLSEADWTIIILLVGAVIGIATALRFHDIPYLLVLIWAYANILSNHLSPEGFAGKYISVIVTLALMLAAFAAVTLLLIGKKIRAAKT
ncbi:MAG: lantibiotic ABC transporter permease [Clostridiales bacterium]|nr:lantibiotic ABC transporter permease [Clostridiales bacterium]